MCSAYVWPRSVQGHSPRLNILWLYYVSALYLLKGWWPFEMTRHTCKIPRDEVQSAFLTNVTSWWLTQSCPLYIFWTPSLIYKQLCTNVIYDGSICSAYVWSRSVHGQSHSSRLNIVWLRPFTKFNNSDYHFNKLTTFPCCSGWWYSLTKLNSTQLNSFISTIRHPANNI